MEQQSEKKDSFYMPNKDATYYVSRNSVPVDASSLKSSYKVVPAKNAGTGSWSSPVNANGNKTILEWTQNSNNKCNQAETLLDVDMQFAKSVTAGSPTYWSTAEAVGVAPQVYTLLDNIATIAYYVNDYPVYQQTSSLYLYEAIPRLRTTYTTEQLNRKNFLFTPIWKEGDSYDTPNSGYTAGDILWNGHMFKTNVLAIANDDSSNNSNLGAFTPTALLNVDPSPSAAARSLKYIQGKSETYTHQMRITLADLIPFCKSAPILNNARTFRLEITWKSVGDSSFNMDICQASTSNGYTMVAGVCCITKCQIESREMTMSTANSISSVEDKKENEVDKVCYNFGSVHTRQCGTANTDIIINSQKNLQFFSMFQIAKNVTNILSSIANYQNYLSDGQLFFLNSGPTSGPGVFVKYGTDAGTTSATAHLPTTIQCFYGSSQIPDCPITMFDGTSENLWSELYNHLLSTTGKLNDKIQGNTISYEEFSTVFPMITFSSFPKSGGIHMTEPRDLTIRIGASKQTANNSTLYVVAFCTRAFTVEANGIVSEVTIN